ncbi:MAG: amidohydrolase family protein [Armatimonadetes bacterium]|nr:amidohydrolase family protein [Armatimonadota bacterium]
MALETLQDYCLTGTPVDDYVVDAHAHMGPYFNFQVVDEGSAEAMVRSMDALGIDVTLVSPHLAITCDWREGNRQSAEAAAAFPGRIVPLITVSGRAEPAEVEAEVTHWHETTGIKGFKFHASLHGVDTLAEGYTPVYEYANEHGIAILSHSWSGEGGPMKVIGTLSERYPNVRFVNAHSASGWPVIESSCALAEEFECVHLDLTGSRLVWGGVEYMVERLRAERILYGSDSPFIDPRPSFGRLLCAHISDDDKRKILGLNAKALYRL